MQHNSPSIPAVSITSALDVVREYVEAEQAYFDAQRRRDRAGQAWMNSQCRREVSRDRSVPGRVSILSCNLPSGHDGQCEHLDVGDLLDRLEVEAGGAK